MSLPKNGCRIILKTAMDLDLETAEISAPALDTDAGITEFITNEIQTGDAEQTLRDFANNNVDEKFLDFLDRHEGSMTADKHQSVLTAVKRLQRIVTQLEEDNFMEDELVSSGYMIFRKVGRELVHAVKTSARVQAAFQHKQSVPTKREGVDPALLDIISDDIRAELETTDEWMRLHSLGEISSENQLEGVVAQIHLAQRELELWESAEGKERKDFSNQIDAIRTKIRRLQSQEQQLSQVEHRADDWGAMRLRGGAGSPSPEPDRKKPDPRMKQVDPRGYRAKSSMDMFRYHDRDINRVSSIVRIARWLSNFDIELDKPINDVLLSLYLDDRNERVFPKGTTLRQFIRGVTPKSVTGDVGPEFIAEKGNKLFTDEAKHKARKNLERKFVHRSGVRYQTQGVRHEVISRKVFQKLIGRRSSDRSEPLKSKGRLTRLVELVNEVYGPKDQVTVDQLLDYNPVREFETLHGNPAKIPLTREMKERLKQVRERREKYNVQTTDRAAFRALLPVLRGFEVIGGDKPFWNESMSPLTMGAACSLCPNVPRSGKKVGLLSPRESTLKD